MGHGIDFTLGELDGLDVGEALAVIAEQAAHDAVAHLGLGLLAAHAALAFVDLAQPSSRVVLAPLPQREHQDEPS